MVVTGAICKLEQLLLCERRRSQISSACSVSVTCRVNIKYQHDIINIFVIFFTCVKKLFYFIRLKMPFNFKRLNNVFKMRFAIAMHDQDVAALCLWVLMGYLAWIVDLFTPFGMLSVFYWSTTPLWAKHWRLVRQVRKTF